MVYTPLTIKAMKVAYEAHEGQCDQSGVPYIFHPIHVAEQMEDELSTCVALLHDVLEDTRVTREELEQMFPEEVTEAVSLLTHDSSVDYSDYVKRLCTNAIARKVKIADINHNTDETRLTGAPLPPGQLEHWRTKYTRAKEIIREYEEEKI